MTAYGELTEAPDAVVAALAFAVDPVGLGGVAVRSMPTPGRDLWLAAVRRLLPADAPWIKVPLNVTVDRLLGGLDYTATLRAGRPVFASGLLSAANGGVVALAMAERVAPATAAIVNAVLDTRTVDVERDGFTRRLPGRFGVIALDEGIDEDERIDAGLADRLALRIDPTGMTTGEDPFAGWRRRDIAAARARLAGIEIAAPRLHALANCASALAVESARGLLLAVRFARVTAALAGRADADESDVTLAARLVLAPRARRLPPADEQAEQRSESPPEPDNEADGHDKPAGEALQDIVVEATRAALPPDLLAGLARQTARRAGAAGGGRAGPLGRGRRRGRPIGARPADRLGGERIHLLATLKAAVPWQAVRRDGAAATPRVQLRRADIHVTRYEQRNETTTIFAVDASGSQAAQRLAEVKGAIELLLHECYARRDEVALIAFRHTDAEVLLPPTRALARARRLLAGLPGGGGTPLAAGIDAARVQAASVARHGRTPAIVLMTDGRANVARDGTRGHEAAAADALQAARTLRATGVRTLLVDTARRPRPVARELAAALAADYVPLPFADAGAISTTVLDRVAS